MTLSPIHWVPVQDKGSKIPCVKFGAMNIIQSDCLHQEYLTMDLGNTSDWRQLQLLLVGLCERWRGRSWATWAYWGRGTDPGSVTQSLRLPIHVSDTAANSQDGSSLEFVAAATARECNIQDARGGGLWQLYEATTPKQLGIALSVIK
jgi:hypothetical protein